MFSKNSKIQPKIPKIWVDIIVISVKNQKFKGIYSGLNFWIELIFGKKEVCFDDGVGGRV